MTLLPSEHLMVHRNIRLEKPLFYKNPYGLRFELGPPQMGLWIDRGSGQLNPEYFNCALERAQDIFHAAFSDTDNLSIVYQIFSDGRRKIKRRNPIFRKIRAVEGRTISFSTHRDIYSEDLQYKCRHWHRVTISGLKTPDADISHVLLATINSDFRARRQPWLPGECYFINHRTGLVLHPYDDRGLDAVAESIEPLRALYSSHGHLILKHDKERMDALLRGRPQPCR